MTSWFLALVAGGASGAVAWLLVGGGGLSRLRPPLERAPTRLAAWGAALAAVRPVDPSERRRRRELEGSVADVCELLAVCLEAGAPPRIALAEVAGVLDGPVAAELRRVGDRIELGVPEPEAWATLAGVPGYGALARDLARSVAHGTRLGDLVRRHAHDARREAAARALSRARSAGVRSVLPLMLCFLPAFLLVGVVPVLASVLAGLVGG